MKNNFFITERTFLNVSNLYAHLTWICIPILSQHLQTLDKLANANIYWLAETNKKGKTDVIRAACKKLCTYISGHQDRALIKKGVRIIPLKMCGDQVLIYIYRPQMLRKDLSDPCAKEILRSYG
ncbi:MAG: DUF3793 family protein [Clostridiales bacterium]|nr:DUF3793 family protein [Clostridiales bacterium]